MKPATVLPTKDQLKAQRARARRSIATDPRHCVATGCGREIRDTWTGGPFCSTTCRETARKAS